MHILNNEDYGFPERPIFYFPPNSTLAIEWTAPVGIPVQVLRRLQDVLFASLRDECKYFPSKTRQEIMQELEERNPSVLNVIWNKMRNLCGG